MASNQGPAAGARRGASEADHSARAVGSEDTLPVIGQSNSLAELAARIRAEHEATAVARRRSVEHGITVGELLLEAKAQVPHGQWLPWLKANCNVAYLSLRSAAEAEQAIRWAAAADVFSAIAQIIELGNAQPAALVATQAVWEQLGDQLTSAIADCKSALMADREVPFATSPRATEAANRARDVAIEMLRRVKVRWRQAYRTN